MEVLFSICRKFLLIDQKYRLTAYAILLLVVSYVGNDQPVPKTYFAQSRNFLNTYLVKYCWGWTSTLTGVFITSVYCGNRSHLVKSFARLAAATAIWFICTNLFNVIDKYTGQCTLEAQEVLEAFRVKRSCVKNGGNWDSFDISGHFFLLIWCVLFITEESNAITAWYYSKEILRHELQSGENTDSQINDSGTFADTTLKSFLAKQLQRFRTTCVQSQFVEILFVGLAVMTLFWEMMLVVTVLYFHTMIEKVIAGLIASFMWYIMYRKIPEVKLSSSFLVLAKLKHNFNDNHESKPVSEKGKPDSTTQSSHANQNQSLKIVQRNNSTEIEKVSVELPFSNETPRLYSLNVRNLGTEDYESQRKCSLQNTSVPKKLRALHYIN